MPSPRNSSTATYTAQAAINIDPTGVTSATKEQVSSRILGVIPNPGCHPESWVSSRINASNYRGPRGPFFYVKKSAIKRKQHVGAEIPHHHDARSNEFGHPEIDFPPFIEKINDGIVHAQSDEGNHQKF